MSSERKYTGMARLFAIEEEQQKEKEAKRTPPKSEPLINLEPVQKTSLVKNQTPSDIGPAPLQTEPVAKSEPLQNITEARVLPDNAAHLRFPYEVFDKILCEFEPGPRVVLEELYRLSAGWDSDECTISIPKLCARTNIKPATMRLHLKKLQQRGYIKRLDDVVGGRDFEARGIKFKVLLPRMTLSKKKTPSENVTPSKSEPNKVNTQKENTQTQESVRVGSKFSIEECRRYAEHLRSTGQGINNPGGYATTIHRTGEADALIEAFLNPPSVPASTDWSQCPDCQGSSFYYPSGPTGGVAKCKHERLSREENNQSTEI
jgi:hypothetical protein